MTSRPLLLAGAALTIGFLFPRCHAPRGPLPEGPELGVGEHTYIWQTDWLQWPTEAEIGNTHGGFAFDRAGHILFSTDSEHAIVVCDADGTVIETWGPELKGGVHSLCLTEVNGEEQLFLPHHSGGKVYRYNLKGEQLAVYGPPTESGHYEDPKRYKPTAVAARPDGSFFVADGYGLSLIHAYDAEGSYVSTFGARGSEPGQFVTPHGLFWDEQDQVLVVADRENHRLQFLTADGEFVRMLDGMFRRPCSVQRQGDDYVVADLAGRVTIVSVDGQRTVQLGDQPEAGLRARNGIPREQWQDGLFLSPHGAGWDADGNLYVQDWNFLGRVNRLVRVH